MNPPSKAEVTFPGDAEVRVTRQFRAPRALVYRAYTEPALLKRWLLGAPGWRLNECEMQVEVGGQFRWRWKHEEDGKEFGFYGEFLDIRENARIVHSQHYDPGDVGGETGEAITVRVTFDETDGVTTVTTSLEFHSEEARDAVVATGMTDGMEASYQLLDNLLDEL